MDMFRGGKTLTGKSSNYYCYECSSPPFFLFFSLFFLFFLLFLSALNIICRLCVNLVLNIICLLRCVIGIFGTEVFKHLLSPEKKSTKTKAPARQEALHMLE